MICYYLGWLQLPCCHLGYELLRVVDVLSRGCSPSLQPKEGLHLTWCTQLLSAVRVSYLLGRMSSIFTPLGRAASHSGVLSSSSQVARFLGGDGCGPWSSRLHFWHWAGSLLGVEAASGCGTLKVMSSSSLSVMTISATCSVSGSKRG